MLPAEAEAATFLSLPEPSANGSKLKLGKMSVSAYTASGPRPHSTV